MLRSWFLSQSIDLLSSNLGRISFFMKASFIGASYAASKPIPVRVWRSSSSMISEVTARIIGLKSWLWRLSYFSASSIFSSSDSDLTWTRLDFLVTFLNILSLSLYRLTTFLHVSYPSEIGIFKSRRIKSNSECSFEAYGSGLPSLKDSTTSSYASCPFWAIITSKLFIWKITWSIYSCIGSSLAINTLYCLSIISFSALGLFSSASSTSSTSVN